MSNVRRFRAACCENLRLSRSERALKEALPKSRSIGAATDRSLNSASSFLGALNQKSPSASRKLGLSGSRKSFVAWHPDSSYSLAVQTKEALHIETPNPSFKRTGAGRPALGFISFSPKPTLPRVAGYLKLQGLPHLSSDTLP